MRIFDAMVTKITNTSAVYDQSRTYPRRVIPARGLLHVARNTTQGIALGFLDCAESFGDWLSLRPWSRQCVDRQWFIQHTFFNLLGQSLRDADDYRTPWGDYLIFNGSACVDAQQYIEMVKVALGEGHE